TRAKLGSKHFRRKTSRVMVGMGLVMLACPDFGLWLLLRGRLDETRWFVWAAFLAFPSGFVAVLAGWFTRGRLRPATDQECSDAVVDNGRCRAVARCLYCGLCGDLRSASITSIGSCVTD